MPNNLQLKETSYTIKFKFASYDTLPNENDIISSALEGIEENFPNCSILTSVIDKETEYVHIRKDSK